MTDTDTVERHKDTERNLILNRTLSDLDDIINGHDPEIDTSINNGVWDRLDKMALEIEARAAIAALPPAVPPTTPAPVAEAAKAILANRWGGYGNRKAMQAMWTFVHDQHGRHMLPMSHYDGVFQAGLRALTKDGEDG